ncbi:cupin domain-containing protein [Flavobacteriaceae bacterium D16]|nr:cupin domain-containing protein [Flavobacteriaceae bacterium D16]
MYEIGNQIKTQPFNGKNVRKLLKNDALEVLSITLETGSVLPEHTSPRDATLIVLEGALDFHIQEETYFLEYLEVFSFPKETLHWVEGKANTRFLIIR